MTDVTPSPNASGSQVDKGSEKKADGDRSRLLVALALIVGMLIILVISVAQQQYTQTETLAAIFSGWITTIVAFYFYGQSNAQAQAQIKTTAQLAFNSDQRANKSETQIGKIKTAIQVQSAIGKTAVTKEAAVDAVINAIKDILQ